MNTPTIEEMNAKLADAIRQIEERDRTIEGLKAQNAKLQRQYEILAPLADPTVDGRREPVEYRQR